MRPTLDIDLSPLDDARHHVLWAPPTVLWSGCGAWASKGMRRQLFRFFKAFKMPDDDRRDAGHSPNTFGYVLECAPSGGQFHAAVLTVCRAW
jgi:hypothetical protein